MDGHIKNMTKLSNRDKILDHGLRVMHEHGYAGASVRHIVKAAGVPQGSFTNHFASKEAFALEVLNIYFAYATQVIQNTLLNDSLPPLERLKQYFDANIESLQQHGFNIGCFIGNFSIEASEQSEAIRNRLVEIFAEIQLSLIYCLKAAIKTGKLAKESDCEALAGFLVSSFQGAILRSKVDRTSIPIEQFKQLIFSTLLR